MSEEDIRAEVDSLRQAVRLVLGMVSDVNELQSLQGRLIAEGLRGGSLDKAAIAEHQVIAARLDAASRQAASLLAGGEHG